MVTCKLRKDPEAANSRNDKIRTKKDVWSYGGLAEDAEGKSKVILRRFLYISSTEKSYFKPFRL